MRTTYYAFIYDDGPSGGYDPNRRAVVSVTENSLGRRHVEVVGQSAAQDYWPFFIESIEDGFIRPPHGLHVLA